MKGQETDGHRNSEREGKMNPEWTYTDKTNCAKTSISNVCVCEFLTYEGLLQPSLMQ